MSLPHVLVITPCGETVKSVTMRHIVHLMMEHAHPRTASFSEAEGQTGGTHNTACQALLDNKAFTHLMFIDSDQTFPRTAIRDLVRHDKDVVGAIYRARHQPHHLFYFPLDITDPQARPVAAGVGDRTGLVPVACLPSGMMLIKRKVIEALDYPWFWIDEGRFRGDGHSNDVNFCLKARAKGFRVYADLDLSRKVGHFASIEMGYENPPVSPNIG